MPQYSIGHLIQSYKFLWAPWQSGYAEDCKSLYAGSIPAGASILLFINLHYHSVLTV